MANKELHSVVTINNEDYSITANKVAHALTVKVGDTETTFDGSEEKSVVIDLSTSTPSTNADTVDGKHADDFVQSVKITGDNTEYKNGATVTLPNAFKNPSALTIKGSGTNVVTYDGSSAMTLDIKGAGATTVTTDSNGVITISSTAGSGAGAETTLVIVNKTDTDTADTVYAITNLEENSNDNNGHYIRPTYKAVPTKDYVDKLISHGTNDPSTSITSQYYFKY